MNRIYSIWFHSVKIDEITKKALHDHYGNCQNIFNTSHKTLKQLGLKESYCDKIEKSKSTLKSLEKELKKVEDLKGYFISIEDKIYPNLLREIPDAPIGFFVYGDKEVLKKPKVAVVGGRKCSEYGFSIANEISYKLSQLGLTVVSGMAAGIDEAAHKGALKYGDTIAVLGTGIDICYPKQNRDIYYKIPKQGCLISEYFIGDQGLPFHFPKRNRIISGLSMGTLVVEAAKKSGSLITADLALEQNRLVFAVPGNVSSALSEGCNHLIQQGAKLVTCAEDIFEELPFGVQQELEILKTHQTSDLMSVLDKAEKIVYDELSWKPQTIHELTTVLNEPFDEIKTILFKLEIKKVAQRLPAGRYVKLK